MGYDGIDGGRKKKKDKKKKEKEKDKDKDKDKGGVEKKKEPESKLNIEKLPVPERLCETLMEIVERPNYSLVKKSLKEHYKEVRLILRISSIVLEKKKDAKWLVIEENNVLLKIKTFCFGFASMEEEIVMGG